jgi:hypothetical protein
VFSVSQWFLNALPTTETQRTQRKALKTPEFLREVET